MHEVVESLLRWLELDKQIYITINALLATRERAEQPAASNPKASELRFMPPQQIEDLFFSSHHNAIAKLRKRIPCRRSIIFPT